MRLLKAQRQLKAYGIEFEYVEMKGLGRLYIKDKLIREHRMKHGVNVYAEEINLMNEEHLMAWIDNNHDRLK